MQISQLFSRTAKKFPDSVAIQSAAERWTYAELEAGSNCFASELRAAGAAKESVVAIMTQNVPALIVALIGTLKSGAAFMLLDSNYDESLLKQMIAISSPELFVIDPGLTEMLKRIANDQANSDNVIHLTTQSEGVTLSEFDLQGNSEPDDLCSIFFAFGENGSLKPVAGRLRAIQHFVEWEIATLKVGPDTRVSLLSSPMDDGFLKDVFVPLCAGGVICIPEQPSITKNSKELIAWLEEAEINILHTSASVLRRVISNGSTPAKLLSLRFVLISGRTVVPEDVRRWTRLYGEKISLVNLYGSVETTINKLSYFIQPTDECRRTIPIGVPMDGAAALVLDSSGEICPVGAAGEIYIHTSYCALGYYQQPETTKASFLPNPFGNGAGRPVYKTGDLGRMLPDGTLELIGNTGRVLRIGDITFNATDLENMLLRHKAVTDVAVTSFSQGGRNVVCAYLIATNSVTPAELRSYLLKFFSEPVLPTDFVLVDDLPLLPNQAVDYSQLPQVSSSSFRQKNHIAPHTPLQAKLCEMWAEVMNVGPVGIHDNFFEIGGHSLAATRIVSRIRDEFSVDLPLRSIFAEATVAGLAKVIEAEKLTAKDCAAPIQKVANRTGLPLSFAQQRLWFLHQLEPESAFYNTPSAMLLEGELDIAVLEKCFNEIIRRHEVLRTRFETSEGKPVQVIDPHRYIPLPIITLPCDSTDSTELKAFIASEAKKPFDMERGSLLRGYLLKLKERRHILLLVVHHIISDGWSRAVFLTELQSLYDAFIKGLESPLAELPIQYADFAAWQREWLQGKVLEQQLSYWKEQLAGAEMCELPPDRPRPMEQTFRGQLKSFEIPEPLATSLRQLSRDAGVTLFVTLLTAFKILLSQYRGQDDVVVGSPIANRNRLEIEGLIGFFVNTLVLRTKLSGNPTLLELLARVQQVVVGAQEHQDLPFEKLVDVLRPQRDLSINPLFQIMFQLNDELTSIHLEGLQLTPLETHSGAAAFDLTVAFYETPSALIGRVEYNTDLYDEATIDRMVTQLEALLVQIVSFPGQRLSQLSFLPLDEQRLLRDWNQTEAAYAAELCLHQLFEAQVRRTPDLPAACCDDNELSYLELNTRANRLAHYLKKLDVGPESLVAISLEDPLNRLVAILGVLKAGGAYLPIDPSYPEQRQAFMLADSQAAVLITEPAVATRFPAAGISTVLLDKKLDMVAQEPATDPDSNCASQNLAYLIYTSGSSGQPKAVQVEHRSLLNLAQAMARDWNIQASDRVLQFASISWDTHAEEIYPALTSGACLVLRDLSWLDSVEGFLQKCREQRVSVVNLPSGFWHEVVTEMTRERLAVPESWRLMLIGGERALPEIVRTWHNYVGGRVDLAMNYGATETSAITTQCALRPTDRLRARVPVGRAISNVQIYVLDGYLRQLPVGVAGELLVGGGGLSRGYRNAMELSAEKFIPDPFSTIPGQRLYRTGDLVRHVGDGVIEHLGRRDDQVKIRGFRIEAAEVEAALSQHPAVSECAVMAREGSGGVLRLVAYVQCVAGVRPHTAELHSFLAKSIPEYMIPALFVMLDEFPRTASGKVDRRALPALDRSGLTGGQESVVPRNETERKLARVCGDLVGIETVYANDNFFQLGGDSLLAMQFIAQIRRIFDVSLPVRALFQLRTIADLAQRIDEERSPSWIENAANNSSPLIVLQQGRPDKEPFVTAHPVGGDVLCYTPLVSMLGPDRPFYSFRSPGLEGDGPPEEHIEEMAVRYLRELQSVRRDPYFLGGWSMGGLIAFEMACRLQSAGAKVELLAVIDADVESEVAADSAIVTGDDDEIASLTKLICSHDVSPGNVSEVVEQISRAAESDRITTALDYARLLNLVPADMSLDEFKSLLEVYRANVRAIKRYSPRVPFDGKILLIKASEQESCTDPSLGWSNWATEGVEIHTFPGNHFSLLVQPTVRQVGRLLAARLI